MSYRSTYAVRSLILCVCEGGYAIPVGQAVSPSIWGLNYNEKLYPAPFEFNPDRFKDKSADASQFLAFSFGPHVWYVSQSGLLAVQLMTRKHQHWAKVCCDRDDGRIGAVHSQVPLLAHSRIQMDHQALLSDPQTIGRPPIRFPLFV